MVNQAVAVVVEPALAIVALVLEQILDKTQRRKWWIKTDMYIDIWSWWKTYVHCVAEELTPIMVLANSLK